MRGIHQEILATAFVLTIATATFSLGFVAQVAATEDQDRDHQIEQIVADVVDYLKQVSPLCDPGDQKAFDRSRQALFGASRIKQLMPPVVLWGRQSADPKATLRETNLTQLAPDILTGLYMPLFMFDGKYKVSYNEEEGMYMATLGVAFRNRLQPGQFPYPFWHNPQKWEAYENANMMMLWIDPASRKIRAIQFSKRGEPVPGYPVAKATTPTFDCKWMWTDEHGKTQPEVTLFDGLFSDNNPYKAKLEQSYRDFAVPLREAQCLDCHVPANPDNMKKLVLLQSPAHAAFEIKRVMRDVREKRMPLDKQLNEPNPLDPQLEKILLVYGAQFEKVVDAAREWENTHPAEKERLGNK